MVLQAFIDDSGRTAGQTFVLAGFISTLEKWERFSDAWEKALSESPSIRYYKNSEAMSRKDEFDGWSYIDAQKKVSRLIQVIVPHVTHRVSVTIDRAEFTRFMKVIDVEVLDDPYYLLFISVVGLTIIYVDKQDDRAPISFVFDEQGSIGFRALDMVATVQKHIGLHFTERQSELLIGLPTFANDKKMLPLQAADLYAGNVRRFHIDNRRLYMPMRQSLRELSGIPSIERNLNARDVALRTARKLLHFLPRKKSADGDD